MRLLPLLMLASCAGVGPLPDGGQGDAGSVVVDRGIEDAGSGDAGRLWPVAASWVEGTITGGFPTPRCETDAGSIYDSIVTLRANGQFDFALCELVVPYPTGAFTAGSRELDAGELARFDAAMSGLTRSNTGCGADKQVMVLRIATDAGTLRYVDRFYACGSEADTVYVDNIDAVFDLFRDLAHGR